MLALLKSDFSIGRSIIQMGRVSDSVHNTPDQPDNVQDILEDYKWDKLFLVEDELGGFVPSYLTAQKAGAQLIFGWRVSMVESGEKKEKQPSSKAIIFVKSEEGWKKLVKIATKAQIDYFFEGARMDWKTLQEMWSSELLLAIPHYDGFIHKNLCSKEQSIPDFGSIKPYVFLEDGDLPFDGIIRRKSEEYAAAYGLKTLNVKTCYYKNRADLVYFQARKLMDRKTFGSGGTIDEPNMEFFCSAEFSLESWEEKKSLVTEGELSFVKEFEKPLELFMPGIRLPEFIMDKQDRLDFGIPDNASEIEILRILARHGYKEKIEKGELDKSRAKEYGERINYELDILEKTDFDPYILLVWDVIRYIVKNGYPKGAGRGSCCSSLLLYLIGVTEIDPIIDELFFERFISVTRAKTETINGIKFLKSAPDCDIDLSPEGRDAVVGYLSKKYEGKFVKLSTFGTGATKNILNDVGKIILGLSESDLKPISSTIPEKFGKVASPEEARYGSEKFKASEKFDEFCSRNEIAYKAMVKLQGIIKNAGTHASAFIISNEPLNTFMPIEMRFNNKTNEWCPATCCDMNVSEMMAIKLDLLGLKTVTLVDGACKDAGVNPAKVDYTSWDNIYKHLQNLESPSNLFQINGFSAVRGLNKIAPKNKEMLAAVLAICRPGSFEFIDQYADYMNGRAERANLHPLFDEILEKTGFIVLYQESLLSMGVKLGLTLEESESLRRVTAKKKSDEIGAWEEKIYKRAEEKGIDKEAAKVFFDAAKASADYSFNKCLHKETEIYVRDKGGVHIKNVRKGDFVKAFDIKSKSEHFVEVVAIHKNKAILYEVNLENGKTIKCSMSHEFVCEDGKKRPLEEIIEAKFRIRADLKV